MKPDAPWFYLIGGVVGIALMLAAVAVLATGHPLEDAAVEGAASGGVDGLIAAGIAALTALAGWLVRTPQSIFHARRNGGETALEKHLKECTEASRQARDERRRMHESITEMRERLAGIEAQLKIFTGTKG